MHVTGRECVAGESGGSEGERGNAKDGERERESGKEKGDSKLMVPR